MRKILTIALLMAFIIPVRAQKYACVNTDYILRSMPEYTQALNKVNRYIEEWQQELSNKQQEIDELRQQYQQEAYLLPDNLKQRRQDEIHNKETELRTLQRQRFGAGGDLEQKRAEMLKPVQDRIYNAIERVAREKSYAFVLDKAQSATVIYVSEKYDISNQVLELMGIKPGANADSGSNSAAGAPASGSKPGNPSPSGPMRPSNDRKQVR